MAERGDWQAKIDALMAKKKAKGKLGPLDAEKLEHARKMLAKGAARTERDLPSGTPTYKKWNAARRRWEDREGRAISPQPAPPSTTRKVDNRRTD
jgi:hypothetical protein